MQHLKDYLILYLLKVSITFVARQYHGYLGKTLLLEPGTGIQGCPLGLQDVFPQAYDLLEGLTGIHAEDEDKEIPCNSNRKP